ncbi:MAG: GNAT family N-acetyltransferase [Colwellia sp.]|nr:GNAT family N-acetyltransferase [Colwellia sp.]
MKISSLVPYDTWDLDNYLMDLPLKWESSLYAIDEDQNLLGFMIMCKKEKHMHINRIAISVEAQGLGIGTHFINHVNSVAIEQKMDDIIFKVHENNKQSPGWAQSLGYKVIGKEKGYLLVHQKVKLH